MENWKDVVGYEGLYQVSDLGQVRSVECHVGTKGGATRLRPSKILTPGANGGGYLHVGLSKDGKLTTTKVHKIVLEAFIGRCPENMECRHRDGNRQNNKLSNLKWGTKLENANDRVMHGTDPLGERNPRAKLTNDQVVVIYSRLRAGDTLEAIANDFGVSKVTASHILCGRTWSHITGAVFVRGRASVTTDLDSKIYKMKSEGKTLEQIAVELSVSRSTAFRHGKSGATHRGF